MEQNDHFIPDGMNDFERSVKPVSYAHLDVYKRQLSDLSENAGRETF